MASAQPITFAPHEFVSDSWVGSDDRWVIHQLDADDWVLVHHGREVFRSWSFDECAKAARTKTGWSW